MLTHRWETAAGLQWRDSSPETPEELPSIVCLTLKWALIRTMLVWRTYGTGITPAFNTYNLCSSSTRWVPTIASSTTMTITSVIACVMSFHKGLIWDLDHLSMVDPHDVLASKMDKVVKLEVFNAPKSMGLLAMASSSATILTWWRYVAICRSFFWKVEDENEAGLDELLYVTILCM